MQNSQPSGNNPASANSSTNSGYSPSVPISLYRQVATELHESQTELGTLKRHNQQLVEQNYHLRLEIERVVQSALQLRQLADASQPETSISDSGTTESEEAPLEASIAAKPPSSPRQSTHRVDADLTAAPEKLFTEQESQPRRVARPEKASEVGGWWLVLVIFLIVVTAFGTGFLIVRPLLPNR